MNGDKRYIDRLNADEDREERKSNTNRNHDNDLFSF